MNYSEFVERIAAIWELQIDDASTATPFLNNDDANTILPAVIEYAELRMQRDLDFIATQVISAAGTMVANQRQQALPVVNNSPFVTVSTVRLILAGIRQIPLTASSKEFIDYAWPNENSLGAAVYPADWAPFDQATIIVGPAPADSYPFEVTGTVRFAQMAADNTSNFLSLYLPDLYVAAACVFMAGYQRDFGAQAEDPGTAQSWEAQYTKLKESAAVEEARKRYANLFPSMSNPAGGLP